MILLGDEVEVPGGVLGDDLSDVGAERQHGKLASTGIVESFDDDTLGQAAAAESRVRLGVSECNLMTGELVGGNPASRSPS